jgi:hypothetical protein
MASGDTLLTFGPADYEPPGSSYPQLDLRNARSVLDFDGTTSESAYFSGVLPRAYGGGGLTVRIAWASSTQTTGSVVWAAAFERLDEGATDLDVDSFASAKQVTAAAPGPSIGTVDYAEIAFSHGAELDSLAVGEAFRLKLSRLPADAADDMSGDAELVAIEVRES